MNLLHAKLVGNPKQWPWNSDAAHIENKNDTLVGVPGIHLEFKERETLYN